MTPSGRDAEARLTALIAGELGDAEARELREELSRSPDMAAQYARLQMAADLVREALKTVEGSGAREAAEVRLSEDRREMLLASFKTLTTGGHTGSVSFRERFGDWILPLAAAAAILFFGWVLVAPDLARSKSRVGTLAQRTAGGVTFHPTQTTAPNRPEPEVRRTQIARGDEGLPALNPRQAARIGGGLGGAGGVVRTESVADATTSAAATSLGFRLKNAEPEQLSRGFDVQTAPEAPSIVAPQKKAGQMQMDSFALDKSESGGIREEQGERFARFYYRAGRERQLAEGTREAPKDGLGAEALGAFGLEPQLMKEENSPIESKSASSVRSEARSNSSAPITTLTVGAAATRLPSAADARQLGRLTDADHVELQRVQEAESTQFLSLGEVAAGKLTARSEMKLSGEKQFVAEGTTSESPYSTFSLNVSDVSFKLAAASLQNGALPEPGSIRAEEFLNAFDYRDPEPARGAPLAFAWEQAKYPYNHNRDILRLSVKAGSEGRQQGKALNLVLLLDNSGSMERADRVRIIRETLRLLATQLQEKDKISVVTFSRVATLRVDGLAGTAAGGALEQMGELTPEGGTNLEEGLKAAYEAATRHHIAAGINRVVLLTDGAANLGDTSAERLKSMVENQRKQGIALDAFGIGWEGMNDALLEELTRNGDGRYAFLDSPEEAGREFVERLTGALRVAAADVKVQVQFNSARVNRFRQVGYARHQLTREQFRDNTVDAAEIGAAEAGNAVYIIELNQNGTGPVGVARARFKNPETGVYHEREWPIPYVGSSTHLEQAPPALRLAGAAAAFAEALERNPHAAEVTCDRLLGVMRGVPEFFSSDPRPKRLEWMIRQAQSLGLK